MFTPYLPFHDFMRSAFFLGLGFAFGVATPLAWLMEWSTTTWLLIFLGAVFTAVLGAYYALFVMPPAKLSSVVLGVFLVLPVSVIFTFPEVLAWRIGSWFFDDDQAPFLNAMYALAAAIIGFLWAYWDTRINLLQLNQSPIEPLRLMSMNIYFYDYAFEARDKPKGLASMAVVLFVTGLVMLQLLVVPTITTETTEVQRLIAKVGAMIPSGFFWGLTFMTLGQVAHLFILEKRARKNFIMKDFDLRLKWRHDYVKYHLPSPIRALNLRLFNQHIEAYDNYQREQNSQSTHKLAGRVQIGR